MLRSLMRYPLSFSTLLTSNHRTSNLNFCSASILARRGPIPFFPAVENCASPSNPPCHSKGIIGGVGRITGEVSRRWMSAEASGCNSSNCSMANDNFELLAAKEDDHGGVIVEMHQAMESHIFTSLLKSSLSHWKQQGKKGVWIKLPIELANLVEPAVQQGFNYHHAEPSYLMLVLWLPENVANTLPSNASHRLGVGAIVMNHNKEILVVKEKHGYLRRMGGWKFPTGVAEQGEDISVATVREVKEETGIDATFQELLAFRQSHYSFFQKSDIFFLSMLEPLSFNIKIQESELLAAKWMPFEDYAAQPIVQQHELLQNITKICRAKMDSDYSGFCAMSVKSVLRERNDSLFLNREYLKDR